MPLPERVAVERLPGEVRQERVDRCEHDEPDVEDRHLVEVPDDPERVVNHAVERDRRVHQAREPGEQPADEAEEERRPGRVPREARAIDRESEAVERQRRRQHERERRRLHERVDRPLRRSLRVVEIDVMRPDEDVRDQRDHPRERDDVARDERATREPWHEVVVDRDRREEQEVDDRMAEPPEHVLREQRVDAHARRERLHDHLHEQDRERQRRDDHVDRDHGQRDHDIRNLLRVGREAPRPEVPEAEGDPEAVQQARAHRVERGADDHVQDRDAPRDDRQPDEQHGCANTAVAVSDHCPAEWKGRG